jgi:L-asparaginase
VAGGHVVELTPPSRRNRPSQMDVQQLPRVDVVCAYPGADGALLQASVGAGAAGIVVAALGAGNVGPELADAVAKAVADSIPVLVCSRVAAGPVLPLYAGGGAALMAAGAYFGGDLSPWQGRLLLAMACAVSPADPGSFLRSWCGESA